MLYTTDRSRNGAHAHGSLGTWRRTIRHQHGHLGERHQENAAGAVMCAIRIDSFWFCIN